MEKRISAFKPRYPLLIRLFMIGFPLLFFSLLLGGAITPAGLSTLLWLAALILGVITSLLPFIVFREILFLNELVIRRRFLPDLFFKNNEIKPDYSDTLLAKGRSLRIGRPDNLNELKELVHHWSATRTLKEAAGMPVSNSSLYPSRGYGSYASFWGLILGVIVMLLQPHWLPIDPRWLMGGTFLLVYFLYIYIIPKYL